MKIITNSITKYESTKGGRRSIGLVEPVKHLFVLSYSRAFVIGFPLQHRARVVEVPARARRPDPGETVGSVATLGTAPAAGPEISA
jgi:hypothetical protein